MSLAEQTQLEEAYVMPTFARKPVQLVSGSGMEVVDDEGNRYLDFIAGIGCDSLGHCHPAVVAALTEQAQKLIHVGNYYYIEHRAEVAETVSGLLNRFAPEDEQTPWKSFFSNSGAESNECAIKLARLYARRRREAAGENPGNDFAPIIVTLVHSFHGRTLATLAATAQPSKQEAFHPLPAGFEKAPINDIAALEALFDQYGDRICAVMMECIQGESGVHPCTAEYLQQVRALTRRYQALLICDEVQCGMFRCGVPFGFQLFGITPDIVSIAKGVASGFPMGMCAARVEIADVFQPGDHGTTFGGSCLAIAAARATLSELDKPGFADHVKEVGAHLRERLAELPQLENVRGYGLMVAADLANSPMSAPEVVADGLQAGLLLNATGPKTLRFLPPLICTNEDVDTMVDRLSRLL